jgi:RNA polymerase sigma factor FliA
VEGIPTEQARAEEALVRENLALVHYLVSELAGRLPAHVSRDDLTSAGMAGLAQAARSYEAGRGIRFDRYASRRIRGALLDELRQKDWASRSVRARARAVREASEALSSRLGRTPTTNEVADHLGCSTSRVDEVAEDVERAVVLHFDAVPGENGLEDLVAADAPTPDAVVLEDERQAYLADAILALPERLQRVVVGYFFEERPMQQLAEELGVTDSRISQLRAEALTLLRDGLNSQLEPETAAEETSPRVAKRKHAYYEAIAVRHRNRRTERRAAVLLTPA